MEEERGGGGVDLGFKYQSLRQVVAMKSRFICARNIESP